ncbi:Uncharacterised protein [Yersinia massiliensis]|uniref:AAA family ATPase n=1 Tax=Yersinia massiliensis TaxID=419257 RepID=UPI0005E4FF72|nr:AAA family ATPase [Yersinia massiliensis]CNI17697.1 Uncharacterised protein [Yersinia massiliensis]
MIHNTAIHLLGASGSGTTSVGRQLEKLSGIRHFDTDSFYWQDSSVPYSYPRPESDRKKLLLEALPESGAWVLSGSLCGWGDFLIPRFNLVIWLRVDQNLRMERLRKRETERYGSAIYPGGNMWQKSQIFLNWAEAYDSDVEVSRNAQKHADWLKKIPCPVFIVPNNDAFEETVNVIMGILGTYTGDT